MTPSQLAAVAADFTFTPAPVLTGGLLGEIVTNFMTTGYNPITPSASTLTPDATFTVTDIDYGNYANPGFNPGSVAQFLDANGQTDGNTVSDAAVAGTQFESIDLNMNGAILLTGGTTYTFATVSDDGSILSIDGSVIVDNNFSQGLTLRSGTFTPTTTGYYPIEINITRAAAAPGLSPNIRPTAARPIPP